MCVDRPRSFFCKLYVQSVDIYVFCGQCVCDSFSRFCKIFQVMRLKHMAVTSLFLLVLLIRYSAGGRSSPAEETPMKSLR